MIIFNVSDLDLKDDVRAQLHADDTGYDYQSSAHNIEYIHNLVKDAYDGLSKSNVDNLDIQILPTTPVLPRFSDVDLAAYEELYPQNAAKNPSERIRILEKLRAGETSAVAAQDPSALADPYIDILESPIRFPNVVSFAPQLKVSPTTRTGRVAVYDTPSWMGDVVAVIEVSDNQPDVELRLIDYKVNTEANGPLWHLVTATKDIEGFNGIITEGKAFYIFYRDVENISGRQEFSRFDYGTDPETPSGTAPVNWRSREVDEPFYDAYDLTWKIVVDITDGDYDPSGATTQDHLEEGFRVGIKILLDELGRSSEVADIESLVNPGTLDTPAQACDIYYETSNSQARDRILVLVKIPEINLGTLKEKDDADSNEDFQHEATYDMDEFQRLVSRVSSEISKIKKDIDSYEGSVYHFDAKKVSNDLLGVIAPVYNLRLANDIEDPVDLSTKQMVRFRWDTSYTPVSVTFIDIEPSGSQKKSIKATKEFSKYKKNASIESKRIQKILNNLKNIDYDFKSDIIGWTGFLVSYIDYVRPIIEPKQNQSKDNKGVKGAKRHSTIKTAEQFQEEQRIMQNPDVIADKAEKRKNQSENNKGGFFSQFDFDKTAKQLPTDLDGMYEFYFNNINMKQIMMNVLDCLVNGQIGQNFDNIVNDIKLLQKEVGEPYIDYGKGIHEAYKKGGGGEAALKALEPLTIFFPDEFPIDDMGAAFVASIKKSLGRMATQIITQILRNVLDSFIDFCDPRKASVAKLPDPSDIPGLAVLPDFAGLQRAINELFDDIPMSRLFELFEDLSNLLSARELCQLLKGEPSAETLRIVRRLLDTKYCDLGLDTEDKVINFFKEVGNVMDLSLCDDLIGPPPEGEILQDDFLCPPDSQLREALLSDRGLSEEDIQRQLDRERQLARQLAEQLRDQIANGTIQAPNPFCTRDENGNVQAGTTSFMDAPFAYMMRTTFEKNFEHVYISFNKEGIDFAENFIGTRERYLWSPRIRSITKLANREEAELIEISQTHGIPEDIKQEYIEQGGAPEYERTEDNPLFYVENFELTDVRFPLPHLVEWYKDPDVKSYVTNQDVGGDAHRILLQPLRETPSSAFSNHLKITVPFDYGSSFDAIQNLIRNVRTSKPGGCNDDEENNQADLLQQLVDQARDAASSSMSARKIEMIESTPCLYDYYDRDENILQSPRFQEWDANRRREEQPTFESPSPPVYDEDDCTDPSPPLENSPAREALPTVEEQVSSVNNRISTYRRCSREDIPENSISYFFLLKDKILKQKKPVKDEYLDWLGARTERFLSGKLFFKEILERSLLQHEEALTPVARRQINSDSDELFELIQNGIISQMIENIYYDETRGDKSSPLVRRASENSQIFSGQSIEDSDVSAEERYLIEAISFGRIPDQNSNCDTHLLRIRDLINDELSNFQEDLCLDLTAESAESTPGRPRLTPLEESLLTVCIKTTVRHYIAEVISTGLLTYSLGAFDPRGITTIQSEYILEKMRQKMSAYSPEYFDEFVIQAYEIYDGEKEGKSYSYVMNKIIKKEYTEISAGILESVSGPMSAEGYSIRSMVDLFGSSNGGVEMHPQRSSLYIEQQTASADRQEIRRIYGFSHYEMRLGRSDFNILKKGTREQPSAILVLEKYNNNTVSDVRYRWSLLISGREYENSSLYNPFKTLTVDILGGEITELQRRMLREFQGFPNPLLGVNGGSAYRKLKAIHGEEQPVDCYSIPLIENILDPADGLLIYKILTDICFPLNVYSSMMSIHEMETTSSMTNVTLSFAETRASLYTSFQAVMPKKDDWDKEISFLSDVGGNAEYTAKFDYNNQKLDTPCTRFSFNYGLDVCWGQSFDGLGFDFAVKAAADAALGILKGYIEMTDPNIKIARALSFLSKLACVNVPTSAYSAVINWSAPWITTPATYLYNGLGLGMLAKALGQDSEDSEEPENPEESQEQEVEVCDKIAVMRLPEEIEEDILETRNMLERAKQELDRLMDEMLSASSATEDLLGSSTAAADFQSQALEVERLESKLEELNEELARSQAS